MKFEWKDEYSIGNPIIDNEHQHLIELADGMTNSATNDQLIAFIMHLYRHTREHFANEEKLMRECAHPHYEQHVEDHNELLTGLISKTDVIREGNWSKADIVELMTQWILHITSDDLLIRDSL